MGEKDNLHIGHRKRMCAQFLANKDASDCSDHILMEMLLYNTNKRKDTNELAHQLVKRFGNIKGIFDADADELSEIVGIGDKSIMLIKLVSSIARHYIDDVAKAAIAAGTPEDTANYIRPLMTGSADETLCLMGINNAGKIVTTKYINTGGNKFTKVNIKYIINVLKQNNCCSAVIAHNHPGGLCIPSTADVTITTKINKQLADVGISLIDHIIVTPDEFFSMASSPATKTCFIAQSDTPPTPEETFNSTETAYKQKQTTMEAAEIKSKKTEEPAPSTSITDDDTKAVIYSINSKRSD